MKIQQVTKREYSTLQRIYNELNKNLFGNELGDCLITLQRQANSPSSFSPKKFSGRGSESRMDEISLNPDTFHVDDRVLISNLVHEMCHSWVYSTGQISGKTPRYHNHAWAEKMLEIGLQPISHDTPGFIVGQKVVHEIMPAGKFNRLARLLIQKRLIPNWKSRNFLDELSTFPESKRQDTTKTKFHCLKCGQNAWAKETASLVCGICFINMTIDYS